MLAAPVTLLLGELPATTGRALVRVLHSGVIRVVSHPVTAAVLNVGGMAVLYLTPLYAASRSDPWLHALVHYHFLAAGYLYSWAIAGPDPGPSRPSLMYRGVALVLAAAAHGILGKLMYANGWPAGTGAPIDEVRQAAQWMYYGGDVAELALAFALVAIWYRASRPASERMVVRLPRHSGSPRNDADQVSAGRGSARLKA